LAKEITTPDGFINTDGKPVTIGEFVGKKVVLIDFWTYSCINCQRTTPYLNAWYEKYGSTSFDKTQDKSLATSSPGLVIIGLHTPEFEFEKVYQNVLDATKRLGIKYPVVLDNDYSTWNAYQNRFWPRKYLIDIDGYVIYDHIGEGGYEETERKIQAALKERAQVLSIAAAVDTNIVDPRDAIAVKSSQVQSPEMYFGSARNEYLSNGSRGTAGIQVLTIPSSIQNNALYLGGSWNFQPEFSKNITSGKIVLKYKAKSVYLVASSDKGVTVKILRDGKPLGGEAGADVAEDRTVFIKDNRLYKLIGASEYGEHTIEIQINDPGLQVFTFTFG